MILTPIASLAEDTIVEPTLSPDAPKYDAEHPELLEEDQLYAQSAILIEAKSGTVIFEKNADQVMYPASTTKIMTVLLGILMTDESDLHQKVTISEEAMNIPADSSTMSLQAGEEIDFTDLLYGTMMRSANEGANAIAETISGSVSDFVTLMNNAARAFGCTNTHFANPHGYHDYNHYTTARDMALIAQEAMKNELFRKIVAAQSYSIAKTNKHRARTITTRSTIQIPGTAESENKYYYQYATGIKTGSHSLAGYCYVGSAEKDGVELISVVFYTSNRGRWTDTKKLMEYGFSQYISVSPVDIYNMNPFTLETTNYSLQDPAMGKLELMCQPADSAAQQLKITATKDEVQAMANNIRQTMLVEYTRDFAAPIVAGQLMGTITYFDEYGESYTYNLSATRSIAKRENAPKTLEEIVRMVEEDPNPWPALSLQLAIYALSPFAAIALLIFILRKIRKRNRVRNARVPKPKSRYLK